MGFEPVRTVETLSPAKKPGYRDIGTTGNHIASTVLPCVCLTQTTAMQAVAAHGITGAEC